MIEIEKDIPEGGIEDCDVVVEELERITIDCGPPGHGKTPGGRLRSLSLDICWDRGAREEKDRYSASVPLH